MPVPAGSPTWFITLALCATTGFCQAQVAERQGHIPTSRSTKTGSEAVGPAQIPAFGTKASGFSGGRVIINTGNKRQELPMLPGGTIGKNQKGAIARPESSPIRFPEGTGFRVPSSVVNVRGNNIRAGNASLDSPHRQAFADKNSVEGNVIRNDNAPIRLPWHPGSHTGGPGASNGNKPSTFLQRPDSSIHDSSSDNGGTVMEPGAFPQRPGSHWAASSVARGNRPGEFPQHPDSRVHGSANDDGGTAMQQSIFPRRPGNHSEASSVGNGKSLGGLPQHPDSKVHGSGNDYDGAAIQQGRLPWYPGSLSATSSAASDNNGPGGFPQHPDSRVLDNGNDYRETAMRPNGFPRRPGTDSAASSIASGNRPGKFPRQSYSTPHGKDRGTAIQPSGFPRHPGSTAEAWSTASGNKPGGFPQHSGSRVHGSGNNYGGIAMQPNGFPRRPGFNSGTHVVTNGNRPSGFQQRPDSSIQEGGNDSEGSAIQPSEWQRPEADVPLSSNAVGGAIINTGGVSSGLPYTPNSGHKNRESNVRPSIGPEGFPRDQFSSGGEPVLRTGNAPNRFPQVTDSSNRIRVNNAESNVMGTGNVPNGFPLFPGFRIKTNGSTKETFKRTNGARIRFAQRPDIVAPGSGNNVMRTNNVPGGLPDRLGFGLDKITNSIGAQILQEEAPMIREIETKMHEGREMERNLTAIRDAIRQEIVGARGIGIIRRIKMKRQLRELEFRIRELHGKNQEGESRFRAFVSGIASGEIRDRRSARSVLYTIFNFYGTIVSKIVTICRGLAGGIINIYKRIALGVGGIIHRLLALKLRPLEAGINIISGI